MDDWTIRAHDPDHLIGQTSYIQEVADKVGLKLSMPKSTMYATSGPARKKLSKFMTPEKAWGLISRLEAVKLLQLDPSVLRKHCRP